MPRFVILEHDNPVLHWDFMLEVGPVLRTWRLVAPPQPGQAVAAEPSFDHRTLYLDYEGAVSGGRGTVRRWDHGTYRTDKDEIAQSGGPLVVTLQGERLRGTATLEADASGAWSLRLAAEG